MGLGLQVLSGRATNPDTTFTGWTLNTGDSLTIRSAPMERPAYLLNAWHQNGTDGELRITSPRLHDNVQGLRLTVEANRPEPLLPLAFRQRLYPQDTLVVEITGSALAVDIGSLLVYYDDVPGINASLATWDEISGRIESYASLRQNLTTSGTAGQYGGEQAINADFDQLKANRDYAILGYLCNAAMGTVGIRGPATGNLRVGGPASLDRKETRSWFVDLSMAQGLPTIPVFNAADRGNMLVDVTDVETSTAVGVSLLLALLG